MNEESLSSRIWRQTGITEHLRGIKATRKLLNELDIHDQSIGLIPGCGTGYSAKMISVHQPCRLVAADLDGRTLLEARKRLQATPAGHRVHFIRANAQALPLRGLEADFVLIESMLVFCDIERVLSEVHRNLGGNGILLVNEMTYLKEPPDALQRQVHDLLGIQVYLKETWLEQFSRAGFSICKVSTHPIRLMDQWISHMVVDGPVRYFRASFNGLTDPVIRRQIFNPGVMRTLFSFQKYIGYGLFVLKKESAS